MWKAVETKVGKTRVTKTKRRRGEGRGRKETRRESRAKEKEAEKEKDNRCEERRSMRIHTRATEERIYPTLKVASNSTSVFCRKKE